MTGTSRFSETAPLTSGPLACTRQLGSPEGSLELDARGQLGHLGRRIILASIEPIAKRAAGTECNFVRRLLLPPRPNCVASGRMTRADIRPSFFRLTSRLNNEARKQSYPGPSGEDAGRCRPTSRCRIVVLREFGARWNAARDFILNYVLAGDPRSSRAQHAAPSARREEEHHGQ